MIVRNYYASTFNQFYSGVEVLNRFLCAVRAAKTTTKSAADPRRMSPGIYWTKGISLVTFSCVQMYTDNGYRNLDELMYTTDVN